MIKKIIWWKIWFWSNSTFSLGKTYFYAVFPMYCVAKHDVLIYYCDSVFWDKRYKDDI